MLPRYILIHKQIHTASEQKLGPGQPVFQVRLKSNTFKTEVRNVPLELTDIAQQKSKAVQDLRGEASCIFNGKGGQHIRQVPATVFKRQQS